MTYANDQTIIAEIKAERDRRRQQQNRQEAYGASPPLILPPPSNPMAVARVFIEQHCTQQDTLTLRYWCGSWWAWQTTHWVEVEERTVRSLLYHFTDKALYRDPKKGLLPWAPTRRRIGDLMEALGARIILSDHFMQPCWLDNRPSGPIVAVRNGLLDINTRELHPHTPLYFCTVSVPFDYDPSAPMPQRWLNFLGELWPDEPEAIDATGEWFGYVISGRLDLQKIYLMIGPTRGGKGIIGCILTALIGKPNVCGPTTHASAAKTVAPSLSACSRSRARIR